MPSLTGLAVGVPSGAVVSNPVYYDLSPVITKAQCSVSWDSGVRYLLTDRRSATALEREPRARTISTCPERSPSPKAARPSSCSSEPVDHHSPGVHAFSDGSCTIVSAFRLR